MAGKFSTGKVCECQKIYKDRNKLSKVVLINLNTLFTFK